MPHLSRLVQKGDRVPLVPSFPAVTCPVQANMTTGVLPTEHGVIANGFYWQNEQQRGPGRGRPGSPRLSEPSRPRPGPKNSVEMWTTGNDCIERPQIWDLLHTHDSSLTSAVWFPLHSKGCGADFLCTPAPIHNPDGSESLWCATRPEAMYGELQETLGHFPLKHFWGPLAGIASSAWIVASALYAAAVHRPNFFYIYLPHLDYAAQKSGPDSQEALAALTELDDELGKLIVGMEQAYDTEPLWIIASEYTITPVDDVVYPNRRLREAGLLAVDEEEDGEHLNFEKSAAWALADHQFSHVFVRDADRSTIRRVVELFENQSGIAEVLSEESLVRYGLHHPRSGEVVLVSEPHSWQAYYWWLEDARAPQFARTVDIHRKPGYDPVELFYDPVAKGIPLDATLVRGSHGAPAVEKPEGVLLVSKSGVLPASPCADTEVASIVLQQFGVS